MRGFSSLVLLFCLFLAACQVSSSDESYRSGYSEGKAAGTQEGYREGYEAARPPGWSPSSGIGRVSLGAFAILGGVAVIAKLLYLSVFTVNEQKTENGKIASALSLILSGAATWLLIMLLSFNQIFESFLMLRAPSGIFGVSVLIVVSSLMAFLLCALAEAFLEDLNNVLALVIAAWFAGAASTLIGHLIFVLLRAPDGMAYVVTYGLAGWMFGSLLYFLKILIRSATEEERTMAAKK